MLLTGSIDLPRWLKLTCLDLLSTCCDRAYVDEQSVVSALRTVVYTHRVIANDSCTESLKVQQSLVDMVQTFSESVCHYIMSLIRQVCAQAGRYPLFH